jgi:exopolysaccharide biosynthesis polyprenyl glycosylphosphotransferase
MRLFGHWILPARAKLFAVEQGLAGLVFLALSVKCRGGGWLAAALALGLAGSLQVAPYLADLYAPRERFPSARWLLAVGAATLLSTALWGLSGPSGQGIWLVALPAALVGLVVARSAMLHAPSRVLVLGTGTQARRLRETAADFAESARIVGFLSDGRRDDDGNRPEPTIVAPSGPFEALAGRARAEAIVVATELPLPESALARARAAGVEVTSAADFCARHLRRIPPELICPFELAIGPGFRTTRLQESLLRGIDLVGAALLLVGSAPLLLGAMAAVRFDSPGDVFYRQERVGKGGRTFFVTKLRTMRADAEASGAPVWAVSGDARITRVGRWLRLTRIDELPQLFSVLRGDMSLVGPRPERPYFVDQLKTLIPLYDLREAVRPGLTGWAQLCYPYGASVEDARAKLEYDLYFIRHRSPFLACSILFHTARTVLTGRGAR